MQTGHLTHAESQSPLISCPHVTPNRGHASELVPMSNDQPPGSRTSELRLAVWALLAPLYIGFVMTVNYVGAFHAPEPHGVKVAVVGSPSITAPVASELALRPPGGFTVTQLTSMSRAHELVRERKLAGAYAPGRAPTLVVATAASTSMASFVEAAFGRAAMRVGRPLLVDDVRPLPAGNVTGAANSFFIIACTVAGFITAIALAFIAPSLPERHHFGLAAAGALLPSLVAYLIAGPGFGALGGTFGTIAAMIGVGALYTFTITWTARLMLRGLGRPGALVASLTLIFLNIPSSGSSVAGPLLPGFWRTLNHLWPGAPALDANRSILYFGGAGVGDDVLRMLGWLAFWGCLLAVPIYLRVKRQRPVRSHSLPGASVPSAVAGA
jgi:hypothetical protein